MSREGSPGRWRVGDAALAHLRAVVDQPDVHGTRYELVAPLGRGGMGAVWRARDQKLERDVALKVLALPDTDDTAAFAARLVQEAKVLAKLEHPGIVPVHDVGVLPDGWVYYAMKLVRGERLDQRVRRGLTEAECCRVFARICEAVAFAHACGVVHCDLKPANVMMGEFGEVLVLDWGLASLGLAGGTAARAGTPGFMAPEQERGEAAIDARADGFALGRLLATFGIPGRPIAAIVQKATAEHPVDRYASVLDLAADVARFQAGEAVQAMPDGLFARIARGYRRYRLAVWLVLSYAVLRFGFELVRVWMGHSG
jgi:eukaryotic-like serine/threonine-protein kinase